MPANRPINALRAAAAKLIIEKSKEITVSRAADALGISRQAIYDFKAGKYCPSLALIQKACKTWSLKFEFRGLVVSDDVLQGVPALPTKNEQQMNLFEALEQLRDQELKVIRAQRKGSGVELTLRLDMSA